MRAWLEVDLAALKENCRLIKKMIGGVGLIAVVKNDAYGHGLRAIVGALEDVGPDMLAVNDLAEALLVRENCRLPILIFGLLIEAEIRQAIDNQFTITIFDKAQAPVIDRLANRLNRTARVHIKINTGLNRLGVSPEEAYDLINNQHYYPFIRVEALYSHLSNPEDDRANAGQLASIHNLLQRLGDRVLPVHLVSSRALTSLTAGYLDAVRLGRAIYGLSPVIPELQPVMECRARIAQIREILPGATIGYNQQTVAKRALRLAIITIGFGDGLPNHQPIKILVNGRLRPLVGRPMMNYSMVDLGSLPAKPGDEVVILGRQLDQSGQMQSQSLDELVKSSNMSHYEIVSRLGAGCPRKYLG